MSEKLTIPNAEDLIFGSAPKPVSCGRGLTIGGGTVYPEINFTLPQMSITDDTWPQITSQYREMVTDICRRAVELEVPGLVVELELLPPMTMNPAWGEETARIVDDVLEEFHVKEKLPSALRVTPVDIRDNSRPPEMRSGEWVDKMLETFERCAAVGRPLLAIESTGGKEIHDEALVNADLPGILFALGVLGIRDMHFLWKKIVTIAEKHNAVASGDTACGFANTAMILADKGLVPKVLAAVVRVASVLRSLAAYQTGAVGPSKDCAYEGPFIKAMTGVPISMEGRSSACAHLSVLGNIAGACCDLWSNESVQNVRLLSASAPVVSLEQLAYDCRLFNAAITSGGGEITRLQRLHVISDASRDPQAFILQPDVVIPISEALLSGSTALNRIKNGIRRTLREIRTAVDDDRLTCNPNEIRWLDLIDMQLETIPDDEQRLLEMIRSGPYGDKFRPEAYGF